MSLLARVPSPRGPRERRALVTIPRATETQQRRVSDGHGGDGGGCFKRREYNWQIFVFHRLVRGLNDYFNGWRSRLLVCKRWPIGLLGLKRLDVGPPTGPSPPAPAGKTAGPRGLAPSGPTSVRPSQSPPEIPRRASTSRPAGPASPVANGSRASMRSFKSNWL